MRIIETDVCVIGSGPGGAIVAYEAARAGRETLIVERGPYVRGHEMVHDEMKMVARVYKDGGLQMNTSMNMFILQASCVGGASVLANYAMFRASDEVFNEWESLGAVFDRAAIFRSYDKIDRVMGTVPALQKNMSSGSRLLMEGAKNLGLDVHYMAKSLGNCSGCGGCNIGCVWDHKKSALTTHIPWAEKLGAVVLANTSVEKIDWKKGKVLGLKAISQGEPVYIKAKSYTVAGGAIGSSGLLLKSKIKKNVGRRVSFNVGAPIISEFQDAVDTYDGDQMSCYIKGPGFNIEPVHNPPLATSLMMPGWNAQHGELMGKFRHLTYGGPLVGTEANGRVVHSPFFGHEETRFNLTEKDFGTLKVGLKTLARTWFAAGAKRVMLPTHVFKSIERAKDVDQIDTAFSKPSEIGMGTSHPQGGNALSNDPEIGVIDHDFAVHGFENLFVCDASVFPAGVHVNPINTIMAVADYAAPRILARA